MTWILRAAAFAMLISAFVPLVGGSATRTVLFVIEGARLETVLRAAAKGDLPALKGLLESGVYGEFSDEGAVATELADLVTVTPRGVQGDVGDSRFVWDRPCADGSERIVVGFGSEEAVRTATLVSLPGPNSETGFIGSNTGRVVNIRELEKVLTPWPYTDAGGSLVARAAELGPGEFSDWIEIEVPDAKGSRHGVFRLRRLDDDVAWLSPVFTRTIGGAAGPFPELGEIRYLPDSATWAVKSSRLHDYFDDHARDVTASRLAAVTVLAASAKWSLLVYVDPLLAWTAYSYGGANVETDTSVRRAIERGYEVVDNRLSALLEAVGDVVVVVVGFPTVLDGISDKQSENWYVVAGDHGQSVRIDTSSAELAATLRYLIGSPDSGAFRAANPVHAIAARYWRRSQSGPAIALSPPAPEVPLTVESLKNLGALASPDA